MKTKSMECITDIHRAHFGTLRACVLPTGAPSWCLLSTNMLACMIACT